MKIEELREYAITLGILSVEKFTDAKELVRTIQLADGRDDCFCSTGECHSARIGCEWESECTNSSRTAAEKETIAQSHAY